MKPLEYPGEIRSMRVRMTTVFALVVVLLMLGVMLGVLSFERQRTRALTQESLQNAVERAQHEIDEDDQRGTPLLQLVQESQGEIAVGGLVLMIVQGDRVIWRSQIQSPLWPNSDPDWTVKTLPGGNQLLVVARSVAENEKGVEKTARELLVITCVVTAVTTILAWIVVGKTLSPIARLANQAKNATLNGVSVRLHPPSSDAEMRHLTGTLNELLERLEREARARGRFYAAASHELRTPIQILLGEIEVTRSRPRTVEEYAAVLEQMYDSTERLATLIQDLLQLNALEMRQSMAPREHINCAYWLERAVEEQKAAFDRRDLRVHMNIADAPIEAPPLHVEVLLRNLVENAAKYATSGTDVRVEITSAPKNVTLEIYNECHLPDGERPDEWFEPFYRADVSRSSQTGGNGLGLAICRALCASNGWNISLIGENQGLHAVVQLPRS